MLLKRLFSLHLLALLALCALFVPHFAAAQTEFINASSGESLRVSVSPQYPKAFETVNVSVEDFSRNLDNLTISWALNGKTQQKGVGLKTFSFTTGALGTVSNLTITIGGSARTVAIRPTGVDLLWQAASYVPPFYKGKALHSNQDPLIVVAEPFFLTSTGKRLDPSTLTYKWSQNGKVSQEASGYGRRTFTVRPSVLSKSIDVSVEVTSSTGDYKSTARTSVDEVSPEVLVYENNPLFGIQSQVALNNKTFILGAKPETTFLAVPFFFSVGDSGKNISYNWSQNGTDLNKTTSSIIFRAPAEGGGESAVGVRVKSALSIMQGSSASFSVRFKK